MSCNLTTIDEPLPSLLSTLSLLLLERVLELLLLFVGCLLVAEVFGFVVEAVVALLPFI